MKISTRFIALLTTLQCPLQCRHCIYECSPYRKERMTLAELRRYVDEIAECGIPTVAFSGGEPFLLGRDLDEIVGYATRKGLITQCITAAHWATSKSAALERLRRLADARLGYLIFSSDDYHQEFVPSANINYAIEACVELNISFSINVIYTSESKITKETLENQFRGLLDANPHYMDSRKLESMFRLLAQERKVQTLEELAATFSAEETRALAGARAYEIKPQPACEGSGRCTLAEGEEVPRFALDHDILNECNVLFSPLIYPDGSVKGCVGHMHATFEPDLNIGNLQDEKLITILRRAHDHKVLRCLEWGGPGIIAKHLLELEPGLQFDESYRISCHLCSDLFTKPILRQAFYKHIDTIYARLKGSPRVNRLTFRVGGPQEEPPGLAGGLEGSAESLNQTWSFLV